MSANFVMLICAIFIQEQSESGEFQLNHESTAECVADMSTKALWQEQFILLREEVKVKGRDEMSAVISKELAGVPGMQGQVVDVSVRGPRDVSSTLRSSVGVRGGVGAVIGSQHSCGGRVGL